MLEYRTVMTQGRYMDMVSELEGLRRIALEGREDAQGGGPEPGTGDGFESRERIRELEETIRAAEVVIPTRRERVYFGATVKVRDLGRKALMEYTLVGPAEVDPARGRISSASPIGRALMGKSAGDIVSVRIPKGELRLEVLGFR